MPGRTPEETDRLFVQAIGAGDLEAAIQCFDEDAVFVSPDTGEVVQGKEAIRERLSGFLDAHPTLQGDVKRVFSTGDFALVLSAWTFTGTGREGEPFRQTGLATDVMRRRADGTWVYVIDNPTGVEIVAVTSSQGVVGE